MSLSSSSLSLSSRRDWPSPLAVSLAVVSCRRCHPPYRGPLPVRPMTPTRCHGLLPPTPCLLTRRHNLLMPRSCHHLRRRRLLAPRPPPAHARSRPHALSLAANPCPAQPATGFPCAPGPRVASASNHTAGEEAKAACEAAGAERSFILNFNTV